MTAVLVLAGGTLAAVPVSPPPVPVRVWQPGPDVQVWVESSSGERVEELRDVDWLGDVTWRRNDAGEVRVGVPLSDPGVWAVIWEGQRPATWDVADVELAVYRQGERIWRGPVVHGVHRWGRLDLRALTQEAYLARQVVGGPERKNWMPEGYFDVDPTLRHWAIGPGVTVAETVTDHLWRRDRSLRLEGATPVARVRATAVLNDRARRNTVAIIVRVWVEPGAELPYGIAVGDVQGHVDDGGGWEPKGPAALLLLDEDTAAPGTWCTAIARLPQHADRRNAYQVRLNAPRGGSMWVGEVEVSRPANVGAYPGTDVGDLMAALYHHLIAEMGPGWARDNRSAGHVLVDGARYLHRDHEEVRSILRDHEAWGDWWVELRGDRKTMCWGPRGRALEDLVLTAEELAEWDTTWDALDATTELIVGAADEHGATREEYSALADDAPHRLPTRLSVDDVPWSSMRDMIAWADAELASHGPMVQLAGVPIGSDGTLPGEMLDRLSLADRVRVRVRDAPLDYTVEATVEQLGWDPRSDRVRPTWSVREVPG